MNRSATRFGVTWLLASASILQAQPVGQTPDQALMSRADSITVGDYCRLATQILTDRTVIAALGADSNYTRTSAAVICNPALTSFSLLALTGRAPAPFKAVARVDTRAYKEAQQEVFSAMGAFRADVRRDDVRPVVATSLGAANVEFVRIAETAQDLAAAEGRDAALTRLANYERKLGPTSAKLNLVETLLNFAAQKWVPGFAPSPLGGPSPWEIVASYAPGYITFAENETGPIPVSTSEFGFRRYLFGDRFGRSGFAGVVLPSYWSIGVLTASSENGALVWPWRGRDRSGAYFGWGSLKIGYIDRDGGSLLLSKQFQAVPFVF